jgi:hypothetical protein
MSPFCTVRDAADFMEIGGGRSRPPQRRDSDEEKLAPRVGLEPTTSRLTVDCSTN